MDYNNDVYVFISLFYLMMLFAAWVYILFIVSQYADRNGRSMVWWVILSVLFTPIFGLLGLYMLGETDEHRKARIIEEEEWRLSCQNQKQISSSDISNEYITDKK
ncbi:hypothetical protein [Bacteroides congonensis]